MVLKDYKPEIDGLRALAVLPVIFFHAGFEVFKGGFVGVDIFFVISGFLITKIILKGLQQKKFSLKEFYIRRARRILPALFLITFLSGLASLFLLSNEQLVLFSNQIFSVILFISNFFFWKNTGYFNPNSDLQPLLHTWSLGVEEQFYIFFPIFLIIIWKLKYKKIFVFLIILSLLSIILSQFGGNFKIQNLSLKYPFFILPFEWFWQAGSANFYLPFGRIWELLSGSMVALYLSKNRINEKKINNFFSYIGLFLILISISTFSENIQYPSVFTILPVLGTVLILLYGTKSTHLKKFLSYKPIVFTGLISYSFYLWHQPIFAFNKIYFGVNLSVLHSLLLIIFSFLISILSWRFVETPFRDKRILSNKFVVNFLVISALTILTFAVLMNLKVINTKQISLPVNIEESFKMAENKDCLDIEYAHLQTNKNWFCELGKKEKNVSYVLAGDSHALAMSPAFDSISSEKNIKGILVGFSGCPSLINVHIVRINQNIKNCKLLNDKLFNYIKKNKIKKLYLASRWTLYTNGNYDGTSFAMVSDKETMFSNVSISRETIARKLEETFIKYNEIGVEINFINQIPLQLYYPRFVYLNTYKNNSFNEKKIQEYGVDVNKHKKLQKFIKENIKMLKNKNIKFKFINFDSFFCKNSKCRLGDVNGSFYHDLHHLSIYGSKKIENVIKSYLK